MYICSDIINEITKYLDNKEYLNMRLVWPVLEIVKDDGLQGAIWLSKMGFFGHRVVRKYQHSPEVAKYNAEYAYHYAKYFVKGPWPDGEAVISMDAEYSYSYAHTIIKDRWSLGEPIILTRAIMAYYYAENVIKGIWPDGEYIINTDRLCSVWYSHNFNRSIPHPDW